MPPTQAAEQASRNHMSVKMLVQCNSAALRWSGHEVQFVRGEGVVAALGQDRRFSHIPGHVV